MLNLHIPEEQKPYKCIHCGKGFATKNNMREHINTHTNARPNKCRFCDMAFNSQASRNSHERNIHRDLAGTVKRKYEKKKPPNLPTTGSVAVETNN